VLNAHFHFTLWLMECGNFYPSWQWFFAANPLVAAIFH
jgi:hypothetical protein